ncbi:carbohydrate ABC transporter substrate-binding protein [Streptomyces sp. NPDC048295]|uniref:carbohydrate ABC transporter substrate-binding protein n=1 Tax=Streptomyces sp. NPDC048295 TaxID=3154617 RepID=UPI0034171E53
MMLRARAVLLVLCLALAAAGCGLAAPGGGEQPKVTILGPWTDDQQAQFQAVLDTLGTPYTYQGTAATREVLLAAVQAGNPPDIAILPGVGDLVEYAAEKRLRPLGKGAGAKYGRPWQPEAEGIKADLWVPLKADLKSIVWYRKDRPPPSRPAPLTSWCIGMGDDGASGWPGSDWIEDLMLQTAGPVLYERWATGDLSWTDARVVHAWSLWAGLLAQAPDTARRALLDDHRGEPGKHGLLFDDKGCVLEHQGSFARSFYRDRSGLAAFTDSAALLPSGPTLKGREVSADFAALFGDSGQARDLLTRLTSRPAQEEWGRRAGVFSPDPDVPARKGTVEKQISGRLTDQRVPLCLDASDVMPAAVRDAFYEAVLLTIADPGAPVKTRLDDVQRVQNAQPDHTRRLTGVCSRPQ